jgi:hypothetical protein
MLHSQRIQLADVLAAEVFEEVAAHQLLAKSHQDSLFHLLATDRQTVRAGAARSRSEARQVIAPIHHLTATALRAFRQAGGEILRTPPLIESLGTAGAVSGGDSAELRDHLHETQSPGRT